MKRRQTAIIIGAGPAGLTAAYELLTRTGIKPVVLEKSSYMGGISRTVNYKGNRIDIGGHRFFSKSDRVISTFIRVPMWLTKIGAFWRSVSVRLAASADRTSSCRLTGLPRGSSRCCARVRRKVASRRCTRPD